MWARPGRMLVCVRTSPSSDFCCREFQAPKLQFPSRLAEGGCYGSSARKEPVFYCSTLSRERWAMRCPRPNHGSGCVYVCVCLCVCVCWCVWPHVYVSVCLWAYMCVSVFVCVVQEVTENLKNTVFGNTSFRGLIGSIKSECYSSLKI